MSVRYMVKKTSRCTGEEIFKILDKDMGWLSFAGYTTYDAAKKVCSEKNLQEQFTGSNKEGKTK